MSLGRQYKDDSGSDTDSVLNDTASLNSAFSFASSTRVEYEEKKEELDDEIIEITDDFTDKFEAVLDNLQSSKSAKSRQQQYESLAKALTTRFCLEYLEDR